MEKESRTFVRHLPTFSSESREGQQLAAEGAEHSSEADMLAFDRRELIVRQVGQYKIVPVLRPTILPVFTFLVAIGGASDLDDENVAVFKLCNGLLAYSMSLILMM